MTSLFIEACVRAVLDLHDSGVINQVFGRTIPVLVHELEYDDLIATPNRRANPHGAAGEFFAWIDAMGDDD